MVSESEEEIGDAFIRSKFGMVGEWWTDFPLSLTSPGRRVRKADFICFPSRSSDSLETTPRSESPEWFRERLDSGWRSDESVVIVEVKGPNTDTWKGLGQLLAYEKLICLDWDIEVQNLVLVADEDAPGEDSKFLFNDYLDQVEFILHDDGKFYK